MASLNIDNLITAASRIRYADTEGENTAERVGALFVDILSKIKEVIDAEELQTLELKGLIQGTSGSSNSRLDPFKLLGYPESYESLGKGYGSYEEFNDALDGLLYDANVSPGQNYGYFRARVLWRDVEIKNILLSSSQRNMIQVISGTLKVNSDGLVIADDWVYRVLWRQHTDSDGWSTWKEYTGASSGGEGGNIDLSDYVTRTEFEVLNREVVKQIQINGVAKGPEDDSGDGFVDLGTITGGDGSVDEEIAAQVTENTANIDKLMKEIFPLTVSLSVSPSSVEYGTSSEFTISWTTKVAGAEVTPESLELSIAGAVVGSVTASSTSYSWTAGSSQSVNLKVVYDGQTVTKTASINFIYPAYMGVVTSDFVVSAVNIQNLTKLSLSSSKSRTQTFDAVKLQKIVYAYAKTYGALTGIVDGNNINLIDNYTRSEITINGIAYYVYITTKAFSTTGSVTYNFK